MLALYEVVKYLCLEMGISVLYISYPVDHFEKNDVSIGYHIFVLAADPSDYRVCRPSGFC